MKNFTPHSEPQPLSFPSSAQRIDPNSHNLNWYNPHPVEQFNFYPDPPAVDMSMSLFDPSEQQFLSGFFDNLVEDKNELILPTNLDFSALLPNWGGHGQFSDHHPKPHVQSYGVPQQSQHPYFHPQTGRPQLSSVGFHTPLQYQPPESQISTHRYLQPNLKFQTPCDQLSSISDHGSSKPLCNLNEPGSHSMYGNYNINFQPAPESVSPSQSDTKQETQEPVSISNSQPPVKEDLRKANHIASEQKRRDVIRKGFEQLSELVPCLRGNHSSKAVVLGRAADYIEEVEQINRELQKQKDLLRGQSSGTSSTSSFPLTPGRTFHDGL